MTRQPWPERAELLQDSLERYFGARGRLPGSDRLFSNWHPSAVSDGIALNYWWLAHAIEARLDAYERTGSPDRLEQAERIFRYVVRRNGRSLFNDYFDDMGWMGIAALRLADLTGSGQYQQAAADLWHHVLSLGWNDTAGGGIAWRKQQLYYKNTPSNGTFIILGTRLYQRTGETSYLDWAVRAFDWLDGTLRRPDGFVDDGINRNGDGRIDADWKFSYNQGLYFGACAELAAAARRGELIERAFATERTAFAELATDGTLAEAGESGDTALFKGVWYRYAAQLALAPGAPSPEEERVRAHLISACDILWERGLREDRLLAGQDWHRPPTGRVPLSAQLSAIIATEACTRLTRGVKAD